MKNTDDLDVLLLPEPDVVRPGRISLWNVLLVMLILWAALGVLRSGVELYLAIPTEIAPPCVGGQRV